MSRTGKAFLYLLYFVMVAVLCGFIITSSKSKAPKVAKVPTQSQHAKPVKPATPAQPKTPATPKSTPSTAAKTPVTQPSAQGQTPSQTQTSATQTPSVDNNPQALVNTGPGDVIGLFTVVSLASAYAYRRKLIKL